MNDEKGTRSSVAWQPVAAAFCFVGSVLALALGFVFTTGAVIDGQLHPLLHGIGLLLLIAGLPILFLGGHFMDLRENKIHR